MNSELLVSVPPRRSAQDGASDEELMLPLENRGRQRQPWSKASGDGGRLVAGCGNSAIA